MSQLRTTALIFVVVQTLICACATVHKPTEVSASQAPPESAAIAAADQRALKRKVAVLRFSNETKYGTGAFGGAIGVPIEEQASDILKTRLVESGKVVLIDVEGITDLATADTKIPADFAIVGSVSEFGRKATAETGVFSRSKKQTAYAAVNLRLVDVRTGKVVYAEEGSGEAEVEAGRVLGVGQDAAYDSTLNDKAISAAISKLIGNILNNLLDSPWQTGVLTVDSGNVLIAGGQSQGLAVGDEFAVMRRGKLVKNPQSGGMMELPRSEVARIRVASFFGSGVDGEGSICSLVSGALPSDIEGLVVQEVQQ
jgi:curli biogenesis system outer membrane secretion channel CsgG